MALTPYWRCGACKGDYDNEDDARKCCAPPVYEVYICPCCGAAHDDEKGAMNCCGYVEPPHTAAELESAGQGRLIP